MPADDWRQLEEIADEHDPLEANGRRTADGGYTLDGLTTLLEAKEYYTLMLDDDTEVETVGGYVFSRLGRPAVIGDEVLAPHGDLLRVEELDGLRVARVHVLPNGSPATTRDMIAGPAA